MSVLLHLHAAVVDALDAAQATHILVNAKILQETDHNVSPGSRRQTPIALTGTGLSGREWLQFCMPTP
jgi:hypothetical protein